MPWRSAFQFPYQTVILVELLFCEKMYLLTRMFSAWGRIQEVFFSKAAFIMYATGGGQRIFFQWLVFLYPPQVHTNFHNPPQAISRKMNTPLLPHKKYQDKCLYNSTLYMFEISRDVFNKNIERALTVYVIPMPASPSSVN